MMDLRLMNYSKNWAPNNLIMGNAIKGSGKTIKDQDTGNRSGMMVPSTRDIE